MELFLAVTLNRYHLPNLLAVFTDGTVGQELANMDHIQGRLARPGLPVTGGTVHLLPAINLGGIQRLRFWVQRFTVQRWG